MDLRRRRGDNPPAPEGIRQHLGERVCAVWAFDAFAAEIALDDFADHFDELWFPASDDVCFSRSTTAGSSP